MTRTAAALATAVVAALAVTSPALAATLSGVVVDAATGEPVPLASVSVPGAGVEVEAGEDGAFTVDGVPAGAGSVVVAAAGYRKQTVRFEAAAADDEVVVEIRLRRRGAGAETVVVGEPAWEVVEPAGLPEGGAPSEHVLNRADLDRAPGALGDPLRAVQKLPGVSGDEGSRAWFRLRGGLPGEARVEVDGIPVLHLTHANGIVGAFGRDLVAAARVHTSGTPVDRPSGLAGGLYLDYRDGPHGDDPLDGAVDLSFLAASVVASGRVGKGHELTAAVRQSFLTAYLAAAGAAGAFDGAAPKADYREAFVRYTHRPGGGHRLRVTLLGMSGRLLFDDVNQRTRTLGGAADWRWEYAPGSSLELQVGHGSNRADEPEVDDFPYAHPRTFVDADHRTHLRFASRHGLGDRTLAWGVEAAARTRVVRGEFEDRRAVPAWAWLPLADLAVPTLDLNTATTWPEIAVWADLDFRNVAGPLGLRAGARLQLPTRGRRPAISPRIQLLLPLKTGTTFTATVALLHADRTDALVVDRDVGATGLLPERAAWFEASVEQRLFDVVFLGAAGWHRVEDHLVVFDASAGAWTNGGTGRASGLEVRAALRKGRLGVDASYALGLAHRTDPHRGETFATGGDQRHEVQAGLALAIGKRRRSTLTADYTYRSGWAVATLDRVPQEDGTSRWAVARYADRRTQDLHRVAARFAHSHEFRRFRLVGSVELAATPAGGGVVEDCPPTDLEDGSPPECRVLDFLPVVMPWLGLRAEF